MKKTLLFGGLAIATIAASALTPEILENYQIVGVSPNGKYALHSLYGEMAIINLETGEQTSFVPDYGEDDPYFSPSALDNETEGEEDDTYRTEYYAENSGANMFALDGTLCATQTEPSVAEIYRNGEWLPLNVPNKSLTNMANGITPDGTVICGSVGMAKIGLEDTEVPMLVPAVWTLQADGTYSDAVLLPHPDLDFTDRVPQYITATGISDNGRVVVGQLVDYMGFSVTPILYTLDDEGKWNYKVLGEELINPDHLKFPEYPGEGPMQPSIEDFMSEEDLAAYEAACEKWAEDCEAAGEWDYSTYPNMEDYASEEAQAAYDAANAAYEVEYAAWAEKYDAFIDVMDQFFATTTAFEFNNIFVSADGKKVVTSAYKEEDNGGGLLKPGKKATKRNIKNLKAHAPYWGGVTKYAPYIFNTEDDEYVAFSYDDNVIATSFAKDYTLFASQTDYNVPSRTAYVCNIESQKVTSLVDYMETANAETYDFMKENMVVDMDGWDWENDEPMLIENVQQTGIPYAAQDLSVICTAIENLVDMYSDVFIYSYILPVADTSTVKGVATDKFAVRALRGGDLVLSADVDNLLVTDIAGRVLYNGKAKAGVLHTGLNNGTVIVRATRNDSTVTVKATL